MPGDDARDQGRDSTEELLGDAPHSAPDGSTEALRSALADLEDRLRIAVTQSIPDDEVAPSSGSGMRRALKRRQVRLMRPVSRRYDRLAADLAGLAAGLAERVSVAEADVIRLQRAVAGLRDAPAALHGAPDRATEVREADADAYYWAFEQAMRGSQASIESRLRQYEPRLVALRASSGVLSPRWLDLGCGRGEFCQIVREWGYEVHGVDSSPEAVEACRERGIEASLADALEFLGDYNGPAPLGISAIQVIEHLPKELWLAFFRRAYKALGSGGALLVETINPLHVEALSASFFADVTHTWPAHPQVARLMALHTGFDRAEIEFVNEDDRGNAQDFALWATRD
jgi:SAM-dependent methyltransferase